MTAIVLFGVMPAWLGVGLQEPTRGGTSSGRAAVPVLARTFPLPGVGGPADRSGIPGRLDHFAYDPASGRLFLACVANGSLEAIDLDAGRRAGTVSGLRGPQGVGVAGESVYVSTGDDGLLHQFEARTLAAGKTAAIGDDADNVRVARDGAIFVSFGGTGPGGLARLDGRSLSIVRTLALPRMPEGFQLEPDGPGLYANVPAGKRSEEDGTVVGLDRTSGERLWERKLVGRSGNFPMALDPGHGRGFLVARKPAVLIAFGLRDGAILGEAPCPPQSDDLFFDARSGLVAVIGGGPLPTPADPGGGGASIDLYAVDDAGRPTRLGGSPLPPHARTGLLVADRRSIYVGVPGTRDRPAEVREYRLPD